MKNRSISKIVPVVVFSFIFFCGNCWAEAFPYSLLFVKTNPSVEQSVLGFEQYHIVKQKETILDIARHYGLGFNELAILYPEIDPWVPGVDQKLDLPTYWVLPNTQHEEVVVNIPEMRLYCFFRKIKMVKTYPIGIGREGFDTPTGVFEVKSKEKNPTWIVPPSAREAYGESIMPPGPNNPLGAYWVGLSAPHIGIHGTNFPWAVGRRASRGCIRLYPEHIHSFFNDVNLGTTVEIIYEPIKVGLKDNVIYMEVHPDIYSLIPDLFIYAEKLLQRRGLWEAIDHNTVINCVTQQKGIPIVIGEIEKGGDTEEYRLTTVINRHIDHQDQQNNINQQIKGDKNEKL